MANNLDTLLTAVPTCTTATTAAAGKSITAHAVNAPESDKTGQLVQRSDDGSHWFMECNERLWPGQAMCLRVRQVLHRERSAYQDVLVFDSTDYGRCLVLDGVIQCTERDEFSYQEMMAHLPLMAHPAPVNVLVIGGGDGGILREVTRHSCVRRVDLCEIDEAVVRVSKMYLPSMAVGFEHEAVRVHIADGFKFLEAAEAQYDVIITDSSDPVGPAESLFSGAFFKLLRRALRPGGIVCTQAECAWLHMDLIKETLDKVRAEFGTARYAYTTIPTYPSGQIGFIVACTDPGRDVTQPARHMDPQTLQQQLRYYSPQLHSAAFQLPAFASRLLAG